ncbi:MULTISPECIES: hypothetical protein [unclassified Thiocapsa]|uniref:hypothetical protein n=1 Tax=unclassified Thiocapsa TaxID=2641286 RepID=UPI0035B06B43
MDRYARFSELIDGRPIRATSAEAFVEDLLALGIAVRVEGGPAAEHQSGATASR